MKRKIIATLVGTVLLANMVVSPLLANADSTKVVTLGADLTDTQKETVLNFFNVSEDEVIVVTVNNAEEREYLEGVVSDSIIGTHTLSCCYINPTTDGGIQVRTANLTWVTENMLANALLTAGIENCEVIATAPFEVSGTGALTGIFKSFETASDVQLDEDKKEAATEELVISAEISDDNDEDDVLEMMNDLKQQAVSDELDTDNLKDTIEDTANQHGVTLTDEQLNKLDEWLTTLKSLDYDLTKFTDAINDLNDTIKNSAESVGETTSEAKGFLARIWEAIVNFFKSLFGKGEESIDKVSSIFDNVNTDVFEFDDTVGDSGDTTSSETD
jgi:uncharacterized protein YpuA (DUF1002 family)